VSSGLLFADKLEAIDGLYLTLPDHALVLGVEEMSQIQALDRIQRKTRVPVSCSLHARSPLPDGRIDLDELLSGYTNSGFAIARASPQEGALSNHDARLQAQRHNLRRPPHGGGGP